jgi:spermidine synthase
VVVQSTSPLFARRSYWCIVRTLEAAGFAALPYHTFVPSFGEWGFTLAVPKGDGLPQPDAAGLPSGLRYLDGQTMASLFVLSPDMAAVADVQPNRLNNQVLVSYYEYEWKRWN